MRQLELMVSLSGGECEYIIDDAINLCVLLINNNSSQQENTIIESVDSICRDSADTQYMLIQTNFSKSPKQLTYKPL